MNQVESKQALDNFPSQASKNNLNAFQLGINNIIYQINRMPIENLQKLVEELIDQLKLFYVNANPPKIQKPKNEAPKYTRKQQPQDIVDGLDSRWTRII